MVKPVIELYTDGSCKPSNPGPGALGYIIRYQDAADTFGEWKEIEATKAFYLTTNNRMEIMGVIHGVNDIIDKINSKVLEGCTTINCSTDSEYTCNSINKKWINKWSTTNWVTSTGGEVKNKDLWMQVIEMQDKLRNMGIVLNLQHVPGHAGHEFNERCDKLANGAAGGANQINDTFYENNRKGGRR